MKTEEIREHIEKALDDFANFRTLSLFVEKNFEGTNGFEPIFTIKNRDFEKNGTLYLSLKKIYLSYSDPTEYTFALDIFGSWKHWQKLVNNRFLGRLINEWRDELEIKLRSEAIQSVIKTVRSGDRGSVVAAKYVAERGWDKRKAGRPSTAEVTRETKVQSRLDKEIDDDLTRLNIQH